MTVQRQISLSEFDLCFITEIGLPQVLLFAVIIVSDLVCVP